MSDDRTVVALPDDVAAASKLLREGVAEGTTVRFSGAGTKSCWGGSLDGVGLELSTARLRQLIGHQPGDMTASVEAGMPLAHLQTLLAEAGQWLALDPATEASGATIGGLLASGDAGPRRLRYGTMRDLAIGATIVLADGTVVHSGSHVIKNVAGYDLTKLFHGSLGSLGLIAEVIVRLHPRPAASRTVVAEATVTEATTAAEMVVFSGVEPTAVEWVGPTDTEPGTLLVRVDGSPHGVAAGSDRLVTLLAEQGLSPDGVEDDDADEHWERVTAGHRADAGSSVLRAGTLPTHLPSVWKSLESISQRHEVHARGMSSAALGLHTVVLTGPPSAQAAVTTEWREQVTRLGGTVALRERAAAVDAELDALGEPPPSIGLLRAVKHRLDPDGRCAPGRFRGWY